MTDPAFAPQPGSHGSGSFERAARNAAFVMVAETAAKLTTFAWTIVAARELTQGQFGVFSFALSLALILASIAEWGFDPVLIQRASREPALSESIFANAIGWEGAIATLLFGTAAIAGAITSDGAARVVLLLVLLATYLDVFSDTIRAMGTALQRQGVTSFALVVQRCATVVIAVPVLLLGGGLEGFGIAFLAGYAIGFVAHAIALRHLEIRFRFGLLERSGMREFVRGTSTIGISGLVLAALFRIDAIILAALKGDAALGAYAAAYRLFETSLFVAFAINGALFPLMAERGDDGAQVRDVMEKAIGAVLFLYLPYLVVCLAEADGILELLFGARYAQSSAGALRWLAAAPLAFALAFAAGSALTAMRRTGGMLVAALTATAVNIGLNFVLIPLVGIEGAAITTTASYLIEGSILLFYVSRVSGGRPHLLGLALPSVAGGVVLAALLTLVPIPTIAALGIGVVLYVAIWWIIARRVSPWQVDFALELSRRLIPRRR